MDVAPTVDYQHLDGISCSSSGKQRQQFFSKYRAGNALHEYSISFGFESRPGHRPF
jgi:hypothetical protein